LKPSLEDIRLHFKVLKDFKYFCKEVLGYKKNDAYEFKELTPKHDELCEFLQKPARNKLILNPRYTFKSGIVTVGYSLWRLIKNPNLRILIYSDSATKAGGFLTGIKNHIEGKAPNSKFRDYYPRWETDPHNGKWNESQINISIRKYKAVEPTIDTGGIETSKVGMHYDLIIFDDIVSDVNVTTKAQMDKVYDCYKKSLSLLKPGGDVILVGTRWHYGDTYGRLLAENREKENFETFITDAETTVDGELLYASIGLDRKFLDYQRKEQGSYIFSCLYSNSPVDDATALFKINDFKYYEPNPKFHENMFITGTCDPAGEGEDFTAITVVGTDKEDNMYILDAVNKHLKPTQIVDNIIRLNYKWGFNRFIVERNFFKGTLEKDFKLAEKEHLVNHNYKKFYFSEDLIASSKQQNRNRVLALQPYHERGQIYLPNSSPEKGMNTLTKNYSDLAYQMVQYTVDGSKSPHDDLLLSLSFHLEIKRKGGSPKEEGPLPTSAVYMEQQYIKTLNRKNSRVPIAYRRRFEPTFT